MQVQKIVHIIYYLKLVLIQVSSLQNSITKIDITVFRANVKFSHKTPRH